VTGLPVPAVCLVVLDGWGIADPGPGNAVDLADTPVFDALWQRYPHTTLTAQGEAVGLPEGQMGNSEVGHLNLGAGAVVKQDLTRIDEAVAGGTLAGNDVLVEAMSDAERVHLIGLVSEGGVHSGWTHLRGLIAMAADRGVPDLVIHAFTDGRDTLPHSGAGYLETVAGWCEEAGLGRIGSVIGRYFAMDRDKRWDRIQKAYDLLVHGTAEHHADTAKAAAEAAYARDETDEFITATTVGDEATIRSGDSVIAFNFRPDRMREITQALADPGFGEIDRGGAEPVERYATLAEYEEGWSYPVAFPPARPEITLTRVIARDGGKQLHVAETEKYAHVTYFFGGGEEEPEKGERRELVPSPRDVPTYDHKPEMSARGAADAFVSAWREDEPRFGIINFANPDMVGHTGVIEAAVKAIETVDGCLGDVVEAVQATGGALLITADHGNADNMLEPDGSPNTAHSLNPVPVIVTVDGATLREGGVLADVAPTLLEMLGVDQPEEMTGRSLLNGG
jgi:2,3-bisphosphoglycerate-independent phosphoglycerate mutase